MLIAKLADKHPVSAEAMIKQKTENNNNNNKKSMRIVGNGLPNSIDKARTDEERPV